ncbi:MAG: type IV toxin-antitoxin system AbiEi family antitoxin domain-containing protein [Bacteroidota bacterium]
MKRVHAYIRTNGGYATMQEMKSASLQTRDIARLPKEGTIEKIKPGLYKLAGESAAVQSRATLLDVCIAMPNAKSLRGYYPPVRLFFCRISRESPGEQTATKQNKESRCLSHKQLLPLAKESRRDYNASLITPRNLSVGCSKILFIIRKGHP